MIYFHVFLSLLLFSTRRTGAMIKGPPEITPEYLERYVAKEGDTIKLICPISGFPRPILEWYQDEHLITSTWERFRASRRFLRIKSVVVGDSGVYVCKGVNGFGSKSVQINLIVRGRRELFGIPEDTPLLSQSSDNEVIEDIRRSTPPTLAMDGTPPRLVKTTSYNEDYGLLFGKGDLLKLECFVDGIPVPTIVWFKDGDILLTPNLQTDRTQTTLMIPNLQTDDSGMYKCKVRNAWGEANATFPVKVQERMEPPQMIDGKGSLNRSADLGESIDFYCQVQSLGSTQIQWLKQLHKYQEPKNKNKTIVVFDYVFEILPGTFQTSHPGGYYNSSLNVRVKDPFSAGRYICLVNNPAGHAHKEIFLELNHPSFSQGDRIDDIGSSWPKKAERNSFPVSLLIAVPILSVILVFLLFVSVFILRKHARSHGPRNAGPIEAPLMNNSRQVLLQNGKLLSSSIDWTSSSTETPRRVYQWRKTESETSSGNEKWVEVTNKANQTPGHWVYGDLYLQNLQQPDLIYPSSSEPLTEGGYSLPKSNGKSGNSSNARSSSSLAGSRKQTRLLHLRDLSYPEYYAVVSAENTELYARPPSDHFYFKISDGKTEFI